MRDTVDHDLMPYYREASATKLQFLGMSVTHHERDIRRLVIDACGKGTNPNRIQVLDYGCGLGYQWTKHRFHEKLGFAQPTLYDPGVRGLETKPAGTFTGVICSDVLEHVTEGKLDALLDDLVAYADQFLWVSVCCRRAKKKFPNGRNLHVTVQPREWWEAKVLPKISAKQPALRAHLVFTD